MDDLSAPGRVLGKVPPAVLWGQIVNFFSSVLEKIIGMRYTKTTGPRAFQANIGAHMDLRFAILLLVMIPGDPALAQYGVSNQRDGSGNLVRDQGMLSQTGVNQSTPNVSGAIRNPPVQRPINPTIPKQQQINRLGAGAN